MPSMPPTMKYVESFIVTGLSIKTQNSNEFNEKTAKLPGLWQQFYVSELAGNACVFGVYSDYESDANGFYTVTVGIKSNTELTTLTAVTIQTGNYLVFQGKGQMPFTVIETWKRIWDYFNTENKVQRNFISDFEAYSGPNEVAIYIGIK